jgi:hypothetical protein
LRAFVKHLVESGTAVDACSLMKYTLHEL